jgi:protein SCO1/2
VARPAALPVREDASADQHGQRRGLVLGALAIIAILIVATALRATGGTARLADSGDGVSGGGGSGGPATSADDGTSGAAPIDSSAPVDVSGYLVEGQVEAPPLALTDQDGRPFDLASLRGSPVLVFFGYTHCPDVCPATVGTIGQAMERFGRPVRAVFVTVDPERDTPAWLREYVRYLATGFSAATGTPEQIAAVTAAWGIRYAQVETGTPGEYSMSHTADVMLVDERGVLRARFPFGTSAEAMSATLLAVSTSAVAPSSEPPASSGPTRLPTSASMPPAGLDVLVDSSAIWAGPPGPVILEVSAAGTRIDDPDLVPSVQLSTLDGQAVGPPVAAIAVRPPGESRVVYVASPSIPTPGWWRLTVTAVRGRITLFGSADVAALDPGSTAPIGAPAPTIHTPTLEDVGGNPKAVTTDPAPDLRLSRTSTTDALASHQPFVLVIDSWKFRVTSACGKALVMARYLLDRWPDDAFIHLEPLRYDVVTDTPVLVGTLSDPTLTDAAAAWGLDGEPWGATSMPWVFVVDGNGIVRAKAEGVLGTDDVDVILALIAGGH